MSDVQPYDWADNLAMDIISDALRFRFSSARELVAARLRLVETRAKMDAIAEAQQSVRKLFGNTERELQRECQADHDEERRDGWAS